MPAVVPALAGVAAGWGAAAAVHGAITLTAAMATTAFTIGSIAGSLIVGQIQAKHQQRKADAAARSAYEDSLKDRAVMFRNSVEPRRIIYGDTVVSGPIAFIDTRGELKDYLDLVVVLASHELTEITDIHLNDHVLSSFNSDGWTLDPEYSRGVTPEGEDEEQIDPQFRVEAEQVIVSESWDTYLLQNEVDTAHPFELKHYVGTATWSDGGNGYTPNPDYTTLVAGTDYTRNGRQISILNPLYVNVHLTATYTRLRNWVDDLGSEGDARYYFQARRYLGTVDQAADPDLIEHYPEKWSAEHQGKGIAYVACTLRYDQDIYPTGIPQVRARVKGKKCYDPRSDSYVYTENSALIAADWLCHPHGFRCTHEEIDWASVAVAANICDEDVPVKLGDGNLYTNQKRYTCHAVISAEGDRKSALSDICATMAGGAVFIQGKWKVYAGAYRVPTVTLTEDDVTDLGSVGVVSRMPRSELFNAVRGKYYLPAPETGEAEFPPITNNYYADQDGEVIFTDLDLPFVNDKIRAQRLAKITLERSRQAIVVTANFNLRAYELSPFETVKLDMPRFGWSNKVFRVAEREFDKSGGINLTLVEEAAGVYEWNRGEATDYDLSDNTNLPNPLQVFAPGGLTADTGEAWLQINPDGTITHRMRVSWTRSRDPAVIVGGAVEVQYRLDTEPNGWVSTTLDGSATETFVVPIQPERTYVVRARFRNGLGVHSEWSYASHVAQGKSPTYPFALVSLTTTSLIHGIGVHWEFPGGVHDIGYTEIYASQTSDFAGATTIGAYAYPQSSHELTGLNFGTERWFWARLVDRSGNPGDFFPVGEGVYGVTSTDVEKYLEAIVDELLQTPAGIFLTTEIERIDLAQIENAQAIAAEILERSQETSANAQAILDEAQTRAQQVQDLTDNLLQEISDREEAVSELASDLSDEATARVQAVNNLAQDIANEAAARSAALQAETLARSAEIQNLLYQLELWGDEIGDVETRLQDAVAAGDLAQANALKEEAQERLDQYQQLADALAIEVSDRISAVGSLQANLTAQINTLSGEVAELLGAEEYNPATAYTLGSLVKYSGKLYRATSPTQGNDPTDTNYWALVGNYTSLGEAVGGLSATVSTLESAVSGQATRLTALESSSGTHSSAISALQTTTSNQATQLNTLSSKSSTHDSQISSLQQASSDQAASIDTLETTSATHTSQISSLNQTAADQATALNSLGTRTSTAESNITNLQQTTADQATAIEELETTTGDHSSQISTLQQTTGDQATTLASLGSRTSAAESSITTLQQTSADQATALNTLASRTDDAESEISTLQTTTSSHASQLSNLTTRTEEAESNISSLQATTGNQATLLTSLETRTSDAESSITTLQQTTADQATDLSALVTRVDGAETNLTTLNQTTGEHALALQTLESSVGDASSRIVNLEQVGLDYAVMLTNLEASMGDADGQLSEIRRVTSEQAVVVSQLSVRAGQAESSLESLREVTSEHSTALETLETSNDTHTSQLTSLLETTAEMATSLLTLETSSATHTSQLTSLAETTAEQATALQTLTTTAGDLSSAVTTLEQTTADQATTLQTLTTTAGDLSSTVTDLVQTSADQATAIQTLETTAGDHSSQLTTLNQTTADQATALQTLETTAGDLSSSVLTLNQTTAEQALALQTLETTAGDLSSNITNLQQTSADQALALQTLSTTSGELQSDIQVLYQTEAGMAQMLTAMSASDGDSDGQLTQLAQVTADQARLLTVLTVQGQESSSSYRRLVDVTEDHSRELLELRTESSESVSTLNQLLETTAEQATALLELNTKSDLAESNIISLQQTADDYAIVLDDLYTITDSQTNTLISLVETTEDHSARLLDIESVTDNQTNRLVSLEQTTDEHSLTLQDLSSISANHQSSLTALQQTTANQATALTNLQTSTNGLTNSITNLQQTTGDQAQIITQLSSTAKAIFVQSTAPTTRANGQNLVVGDIWYDTGNNNQVKRWSGSTWANIADTRITTALNNAATANSNASSALSKANSVDLEIQAVTSDLEGLYGVKLAANGGIAGFALSLDPSTTQSAFIIRADKFSILNSNSNTATGVTSPFTVSGGSVYMNSAIIKDGSIGVLKVAGEAIIAPRAVTNLSAKHTGRYTGSLLGSDLRGTYDTMVELTVTLPPFTRGYVFATAAMKQHYTNINNPAWEARLLTYDHGASTGTEVCVIGGTQVQDGVSLAGGKEYTNNTSGERTYTVQLQWAGKNTIQLQGRSMIIQIARRRIG
jgi:chromosome segregation ATPase